MIIDFIRKLNYIMNMKILMIKLPEDLHRKFKTFCSSISKTMREVIIEMMEERIIEKKTESRK